MRPDWKIDNDPLVQDEDCGCPQENWIFQSYVEVNMHLEDGELAVYAATDGWDETCQIPCASMEAGRPLAMAWVESLLTQLDSYG